MALAIGITQHCSGRIGFYVKALQKLGCTRAEREEMLAVCVYMGGGPALVYAAETMAAWEKLSPAQEFSAAQPTFSACPALPRQ
jgi:alkylhydroperoxidase/carboxymuconolactone decarboxylase family protein YurZ